MPRHLIAIRVDPAFRPYVRPSRLRAVARHVLAREGVKEPLAVSIVITDDETIRALNARYLGEDAPTDVLAFPLGEAFITPLGRPRPLGEVVISLPTARRQAQGLGHSPEREVTHLLIHGLLHLLGYDHARPEEERAMRGRQEELLAGLEGEGILNGGGRRCTS